MLSKVYSWKIEGLANSTRYELEIVFNLLDLGFTLLLKFVSVIKNDPCSDQLNAVISFMVYGAGSYPFPLLLWHTGCLPAGRTFCYKAL